MRASLDQFIIDGMNNKFSQKYFFTTTNHISVKTEETIVIFESQKMTHIGIDWTKFDLNQFDKNSKLEVIEKKKLTNTEIQIVNDFINAFQNDGDLRWSCREYLNRRDFISLKIV
ncbi:hypothetical protein MCAV_06850 [[Mycoplasma] cavipharyngis]